MNLMFRRILAIIVRVAVVIALAILGFLLYVTFECPFTKPNDKGKIGLCRQQMRGLMSVTNLFSTAQEVADNLRNWKDPWGHCYNVIVADNFAIDSFGHDSGGNIIMWSSGPNGINENGDGDDIVFGNNNPVKLELNGGQK